MQPRRAFAATVLVAAALNTATPAAHGRATQATPPGGAAPATAGDIGIASCGAAYGAQGQGSSGGSNPNVCTGSGEVVLGPSVNVNTAVGPAISGAGFTGAVTVANGPVAIVP